MKTRWHALIMVFIFVSLIFVGSQVYSNVEGWNYLDSAYFLVITATTIGYGDLTPQTSLGKIMTITYSFIGIFFVFYMISLISHLVFENRLEEKVVDLHKKKEKIKRLKKE